MCVIHCSTRVLTRKINSRELLRCSVERRLIYAYKVKSGAHALSVRNAPPTKGNKNAVRSEKRERKAFLSPESLVAVGGGHFAGCWPCFLLLSSRGVWPLTSTNLRKCNQWSSHPRRKEPLLEASRPDRALPLADTVSVAAGIAVAPERLSVT